MGAKDRTRVKTKTNQERNDMTHIWYLLKWNARSQSLNTFLSLHQDVVQIVLKSDDNHPIISSQINTSREAGIFSKEGQA